MAAKFMSRTARHPRTTNMVKEDDRFKFCLCVICLLSLADAASTVGDVTPGKDLRQDTDPTIVCDDDLKCFVATATVGTTDDVSTRTTIQQRPVTVAVAGNNATFTCEPRNGTNIRFEFFPVGSRSTSPIQIYLKVGDSQKFRENETNWLTTNRNTGRQTARIDFATTYGVDMSQAGTYLCSELGNEDGKEEQELVVFADKPTCEFRDAMGHQSQIVAEHELVRLTCAVNYSGNWRPAFQCFLDNEQGDNGAQSTSSEDGGRVQYEWRLNATRELLNKTVKCLVNFTRTAFASSWSLPPTDRFVWESPPINVTYGPMLTRIDGNLPTLTCTAVGNPRPNIEWRDLSTNDSDYTVVSKSDVRLDVCLLDVVVQFIDTHGDDSIHDVITLTLQCVAFRENFTELINMTVNTTRRDLQGTCRPKKADPGPRPKPALLNINDIGKLSTTTSSTPAENHDTPMIMITVPLVVILAVCIIVISVLILLVFKRRRQQPIVVRKKDADDGRKSTRPAHSTAVSGLYDELDYSKIDLRPPSDQRANTCSGYIDIYDEVKDECEDCDSATALPHIDSSQVQRGATAAHVGLRQQQCVSGKQNAYYKLTNDTRCRPPLPQLPTPVNYVKLNGAEDSAVDYRFQRPEMSDKENGRDAGNIKGDGKMQPRDDCNGYMLPVEHVFTVTCVDDDDDDRKSAMQRFRGKENETDDVAYLEPMYAPVYKH